MIILLLLIWVHEEFCIRIIIRFEVVGDQELNMKIKLDPEHDLELDPEPELELDPELDLGLELDPEFDLQLNLELDLCLESELEDGLVCRVNERKKIILEDRKETDRQTEEDRY